MAGWLRRNAEGVEAAAAVVTACVAVAALVGVKVQIDASDRSQALQGARSAYLAQQALAVQNPRFARPADACALIASADGAAYEAFVSHLLFTAEQALAVQEGWDQTFLAEMEPHVAYLCANLAEINATVDVHALLARFASAHCADAPQCPAG